MRIRNLFAGLGLLVGAVGCHHVAGFCDCNPPIQPCAIYGLHPMGDAIVVTNVVETPTAPKPMPASPAKPAASQATTPASASITGITREALEPAN